jgi:hypothetical protein
MTDPNFGERTGIPRWVTLSVLVGLLVAVVVVVMLLVGGGHTIPRHGGGDPPPSSVPAPAPGGHVRPPHG